ncbi:MAG: M20/M25/M40 family metallo-hydrolase [Deltaproteobacteria bacterium]|jgi:acetylornithine deacetylase
MPRIDPIRLKKLFTDLVDIYSPSGKEGEAIDYLHRYLEGAGFTVERQEMDEERANLIVLPPSGEAEVVLLGHVDTVPAPDFEHYGADEHEDEIRGLGTADMKSGCAAAIEALQAFQASGNELPVALALVVGEEETGDGTAALLRDYQFDWAVIGEPTDLRPCFSHYSYIEINLGTTGQRMHASQAHKAKNAIRIMLSLLADLINLIEESHPEVIYNLRDLSSASAGFAVSDSCECWLDLHLPPELSTSTVIKDIEKMIRPRYLHEEHPDVWYSFQTIHAGYTLDEQTWLPLLIRNAFEDHSLPWQPESFPSHSDANLLWASGVKPILFGPGSLELAHTSDEAISFGQVATAATIYLDLLLALSRR